jgi:hypothetical protein
LSLEGKSREVVLGISARTLNSEDGMKILLEALDEVFQKAAIDCAYEAYSEFEKFNRSCVENMSMSEYIITFEQKYN